MFSALIKDSFTAELIFESDLKLYSPEFIIEEFMKYKEIISKKASRTEEEFIQKMHLLNEIITVVSKEKYSNLIEEAKLISPDEKDSLYFALALKLNIPIWSNDKRLKEQNKVKVYSTKELLALLKKINKE